MEIVQYNEDYAEQWDSFIAEKSVNGTFLQSRRFLSYHPEGRFTDASLLVMEKNRILAVIPACVVEEESGMRFYSHRGSTFGGLVVRDEYYKTGPVLEMTELLDAYLKEHYAAATLAITADPYCTKNSELLQFALGQNGYTCLEDLNSCVDLTALPDDVKLGFDRNKNRNIRKAESFGLTFRELTADEDVAKFYELLTINLSKYDAAPIHTLEEILDFKNSRIPEHVRFYGVFQEEEMKAGGMMFVFPETNVIHAQNLSANYQDDTVQAITYLYYKVIEQAKHDGFKTLTWGISTEHGGKNLNLGLIRNKESYGSTIFLNRTYTKNY